MKIKTGKLLLLIACLLFLSILVACSNSSTSTDNEPNEGNGEQGKGSAGTKMISIGITDPPGTFAPWDRNDLPGGTIANILFNPLLEYEETEDGRITLIPMLADRIETEDNQHFKVHLNPNAKWTDGTPVTAEDVLFTIEIVTHPNISSMLLSSMASLAGTNEIGKRETEDFSNFEGARVINDHTLEIITKHPIDDMLFNVRIALEGLRATPKHILGDVPIDKLYEHPFMRNPNVSYGAFKWSKYEDNQYVELVANEEYYKGAPKIDKLYFRIMPPSNLVAQLQSGEIHMNQPDIGTIPVQDYETVQNLSNVRVSEGLPVGYKFLGFNVDTVSDVRVRKAIAYAINREAIVNNLLKGHAVITNSVYSPVNDYYNHDLGNPYPYDPEKAKQLLAEAGWDNSRPLVFIVPSGNVVLEQMAELITENLRSVGIDVDMRKMDNASAMAQLRKKEGFDLWVLAARFIMDPDVSGTLMTGASSNMGNYDNPEVNELFTKGLKAIGQERKEVYDRFQEILMDELPVFPLIYETRLRAVSTKVQVGEPRDLGMFANVHEWDITN